MSDSHEAGFNVNEARTAIMCCLCPRQHGGLKKTVDGRWVHLCCAIWSKDAIITNLSDMGPVDVRDLPVQVSLDFRGVIEGVYYSILVASSFI